MNFISMYPSPKSVPIHHHGVVWVLALLNRPADLSIISGMWPDLFHSPIPSRHFFYESGFKSNLPEQIDLIDRNHEIIYLQIFIANAFPTIECFVLPGNNTKLEMNSSGYFSIKILISSLVQNFAITGFFLKLY
jgi:hypothetical protein